MKCVVVDHPFGVASIKLAEHPKSGALGDARIPVRITAGSLNSRDLLVANGTGRWAPTGGRIPGSD